MSALRVEVLRGDRVESVHRVDVALARPDGSVEALAGDADREVFVRSAIKPFQALPLVEEGAAERYGLGDRELALCCASHGGEAEHVALAASMLERLGLGEEALACGPHPPYYRDAARALEREGRSPSRLHNNCSGKHAGMLTLAAASGWPTAGYHEADHPVQRRVQEELARWTGVPAAEMGTAVDGCGVVTFGLPLGALALGFARLAEAGGETGSPAARILDAMGRHPFLVGGTDRLCTRLMEVTSGRVVAKVGAEGVYGALSRSTHEGIALKARDGATRAAEVALLWALEMRGLLEPGELEELKRWARPEIRNTRDEAVGSLRPAVSA